MKNKERLDLVASKLRGTVDHIIDANLFVVDGMHGNNDNEAIDKKLYHYFVSNFDNLGVKGKIGKGTKVESVDVCSKTGKVLSMVVNNLKVDEITDNLVSKADEFIVKAFAR